jgi:Rhs element Vgr protein
MSAPSPLAADTSLVSFAVKVDGQPIDSAYQVDSIDTWTAVNRVPKARLVIFDGSPAAGDFPIADRPTFVPGRKVEIAIGYREKQTTIFRGLVVRQGIAIDRRQGSRLVVDATDEALRMTLQRRNGLFLKVKDGELIAKLIKDNGLAAEVAATNTLHAEVVQYYATDWDLVLTRAEMNGLVAIAEAGKVSVKAPDTSASPVLTLTYGESILDLEAQLDAATQYASSAVKSASWDFAAQKVAQAGPGSVRVKEPGNLSSDELARVFKVKAYVQQTGGSLEPTALTDWSSAFLLKSRLSKLRGSVRFQGSALAKTGAVVLLAGCGARFDGPVFVSGVHHEVRDGVWLTTAELGLSPRWFTAEADGLAAPEASGQLPPIRGLQTGVVKQLDQDPDGEFRVQVALPILQDDAKRLWVRLSAAYASDKAGVQFYPEIGDEVVLAFMNEDPRYGVILGSLHGKKRPPAYPPDAKNKTKAIVTRGKLELSFDDEDKVIEIRTPGKHSIRLDDKSGQVTVVDASKNSVTLAKNGVTIESASNLTLKAKANVVIDAGANLSLAAKANATLEGLQVALKAKTKFSAAGTAAAEVTASGMLTLKGALVKIN